MDRDGLLRCGKAPTRSRSTPTSRPPCSIDGQAIAGAVHLAAGAHQLQLHYAHRGGPIRFNFLWARDHEPLAPVPGWALRPRKIRSVPRLMARAALDRALALSEWVWVGLLVLAAASLARSGLAPRPAVARARLRVAVAAMDSRRVRSY